MGHRLPPEALIKSRLLQFDGLECRLTLSSASFVEHQIDMLEEVEKSVVLADLDGDGDVDALFASSNGGNLGVVSWRENLGAGDLGRRQTITTGFLGVAAVTAADIDGDGDLDVSAVSSYASDDRLRGFVEWYENTDGKGAFGTPKVIGEQTSSRSIRAADVNGDGYIDLVSAATRPLWYENLGGSGEFQVHVVPDILRVSNAIPFDADGDLDTDLLIQRDDDAVVLYENVNGLGEYRRVSSIEVRDPEDVIAIEIGDINADGGLDAVVVISQRIAWYDVSDGEFRLGGEVAGGWSPSAVSVSDVDGDGDLDVVGSGLSPFGVSWYENIDGLGSFSADAEHSIAAGRSVVPQSMAIGDIDGDGREDLLVATIFEDRLIWYENRVPGDADDDGIFNSSDLVEVFQADKYESAGGAKYDEGDWNGDGQFDSSDLVFAFKAGTYVAEAQLDEHETATAVDWIFAHEEVRKRRCVAIP